MTAKKTPEPPPSLAPGDPHPLIAKKKASLAAKFSPKRMSALYSYVEIAWYLAAVERLDEARAMTDWVVDHVPFTGDFNVWTPASCAIALSARLARQNGDDASRQRTLLTQHLAIAVMTREALVPWVAREPARIHSICARKLKQADLSSLYGPCASAAYYRESCLPGVYFETWLDTAGLDDAITAGTRAMAQLLAKHA